MKKLCDQSGRTVFPRPLGASEERDCFEKMAQGDKSAHDRLIRHNLRLVAHIREALISTPIVKSGNKPYSIKTTSVTKEILILSY